MGMLRVTTSPGSSIDDPVIASTVACNFVGLVGTQLFKDETFDDANGEMKNSMVDALHNLGLVHCSLRDITNAAVRRSI